MRIISAIARHELKLFFRDRRAWLLLFIIPISISSFMGAMTGSIAGTGRSGLGKSGGLSLLIVDQDDSPISRRIVLGFARDPQFALTVTNESVARELVLSGRRPVAVILPPQLGAHALPGLFDLNRKPHIKVWYDPSRAMERQLVEGLLIPKVLEAVAYDAVSGGAGLNFVQQQLTNLAPQSDASLPPRLQTNYQTMLRLTEQLLTERANRIDRIDREVDAASTRAESSETAARGFSLPLPFLLRAEPLTQKHAEYNAFSHSFAGMGLQFVLMSMVDLALALLRERDSGVFRRLRSMPLGRGSLLTGKVLAWTVTGLISFTGCFAFAMVVFGVRIEGSWLGFAAVLVATSLLAASLGLLLAAVGKTPAGARGLAILVVLLLVMIGGAWIPSFVFPSWVQQVSLMTPTRWALDGMDAMTWRGLGFEATLRPIAVLLGFSLLFGAIGWLRFRWDAE